MELFCEYLRVFITGGIICTIGQILIDKTKLTPARILVIFVTAGVILTGLGIYPLITTWGGAGSLVPITGFANSVAAPAIEYKKEGQVFGIGCKIFTIAGPVILYGIFFSWLAGLVYWITKVIAM